MKDSINTDLTSRDKVLVIILLSIIAVIVAAISIVLIRYKSQQGLVPQPRATTLISGNSEDYLPTVADLPKGFVLMEDNPVEFNSGGNVHTRTFTNPDFVLQGREVNVVYWMGIFDEQAVAQDILDKLYSGTPGMSGILSVEPNLELQKNFSNTESVKILFAHELTELNTYAISYTVFLRYRNVMTMIVVSAPVDDFDSNDAQQVKAMLGQAVLYYSNLVTRKLPDHILSNVPQPPFGAVQMGSSFFSDDFEQTEITEQIWEVIDGRWEIVDGTYFCRADSSRCVSMAADSGLKNYVLSLDIKGNEGVDKFIDLGFIEGKQLYELNFRSDPYNDLVLTEALNGTSTQIKSVGIQNKNGNWYHFEIMVYENSIQVFVDNQLVLVASNLSSSVTGKMGLGLMYSAAQGAGVTSVYFDNVKVEPYR
jgi:hypothetical protein